MPEDESINQEYTPEESTKEGYNACHENFTEAIKQVKEKYTV